MTQRIVLASASPYRRKMLEQAGLDVAFARPDIDERAVEAALGDAGTTPDDLALVLAEAKAMDVAVRDPGALVIGCDQTLSIDGEVLHKPEDMEAARRRLLRLSGKTHQLNTAVVLVRGDETLWRHVDVVSMTMRRLDPAFVGRHLAEVGDKALTSVGAYQIEGAGIQLFEAVDGDFFSIVGLPLLPLLSKLRELGAIDG